MKKHVCRIHFHSVKGEGEESKEGCVLLSLLSVSSVCEKQQHTGMEEGEVRGEGGWSDPHAQGG
jgi:hypothetical protein